MRRWWGRSNIEHAVSVAGGEMLDKGLLFCAEGCGIDVSPLSFVDREGFVLADEVLMQLPGEKAEVWVAFHVDQRDFALLVGMVFLCHRFAMTLCCKNLTLARRRAFGAPKTDLRWSITLFKADGVERWLNL